MHDQIVWVDGTGYKYILNGIAPLSPVECKGGRWFILMGFAGFNTKTNNFNGYQTRERALADIRKHQTSIVLQEDQRCREK